MLVSFQNTLHVDTYSELKLWAPPLNQLEASWPFMTWPQKLPNVPFTKLCWLEQSQSLLRLKGREQRPPPLDEKNVKEFAAFILNRHSLYYWILQI